jgi:hypothetical protein
LHCDHLVIGPSTLKGGNLTFWTAGPRLTSEARKAMTFGREFTVCLTAPDGLKEVTGKVMSVEMVEGAHPTHWEIVMRL